MVTSGKTVKYEKGKTDHRDSASLFVVGSRLLLRKLEYISTVELAMTNAHWHFQRGL